MKFLHAVAFALLSLNLYAQAVIKLSDDKPKGSESWTWSETTSTNNMFNTEIVYNVSEPTITAFLPPKEAANGTAVIVAPGGAFHTLTINSEGIDVAKWLNSKGIAAFVLKYRLARSFTDDPVKELIGKMGDFKKLDEENAPIIPLATDDGLAAVKYVRAHAKEMNIDPSKIGFMGFSAGGTLTMSVVYSADDESRPNFVAPIYAYEPAIIGSNMPKEKIPIFVCVAGNDGLGMMPMSINIYKKWYDAKQPAELHIYEKGDHGFGMRKQNLPTDTWHERFGDWLKMQGLMMPIVATGMFQRIPTPNDTLQSVKQLADARLMFSIYAPDAQAVTLSGDFPSGFPAAPLDKGYNGVWTMTTKSAVTPDIYSYDFTVDGIRTLDPKNAQFKESNTGFSNIYELPGKENDFQSIKNVPHGRVEKRYYKSAALNGANRRMHIYLPPNYDKLYSKKKLPVLYLLHGGGDNDASWTSAGRANFILDNLYAEGKLAPMIVVMTSGHTSLPGGAMGAGPAGDPFTKDFFNEIIPFVETNYAVSAKREHRAIVGLSMGGLQTLNIALWNPDKFSYVFPLSTGYFPNLIKELEEKHTSVFTNKAIAQFKKFKIYMGGENDIAYQNNLNTMKLLDKYNIKYEYENIPGGHTFLVWRRNLANFAPLLFR